MVLARVANFFSSDTASHLVSDGPKDCLLSKPLTEALPVAEMDDVDEEAARPPYIHVRLPER